MSRVVSLVLVLVGATALPTVSHAYQFSLTTGGNDSRAIHLRVGDRGPQDLGTNYEDGYGLLFGFPLCTTFLFGANCAGGSPSPGRTGNRTVVTANVSNVGAGAVPMTSGSTGSHLSSSYDGTTRCSQGQVYIGGFSRRPGTTNAARITVQAEPNLRNGVYTIPISEISWQTSGGGIASGTLSASPQQIGTIPANAWVEACMSFSFANTTVRAGGEYEARATYTISLP